MGEACMQSALGRELSEEEGAAHADSVRVVRDKGLDTWQSSGAFEPFKAEGSVLSAVDTRWL